MKTNKKRKLGVKQAKVKKETFTQIDSIDKLWGINTIKYKEKTLDEYIDKINAMSINDLHGHAYLYDVSSALDRETIINQLIRLFKADFLSKNKTNSLINIISSDTNKKIKDILDNNI